MSVIKNKVQLIDLIVSSLTDSPILSKSCLVVTGSKETQYKIRDGVVTPFPSLNITHEEADIIIINQLLWVVKEKPQARVLVICDDTDVFVLLTHYYTTEKMECQLFTQGPTRGRKLISIQGTALNTRTNLNTDPELLLPLHALTGCDSVSHPIAATVVDVHARMLICAVLSSADVLKMGHNASGFTKKNLMISLKILD